MPDHSNLMDSGFLTFGLSSAVDYVCDFASKGDAEREALRLDEGAILAAWVRLGNLIETLNLRRAA